MASGKRSMPANGTLAELLDELGWSPRALARKINRDHGMGTVAESAPYHWRDSGGVPRPPVPGYVADVLGRALGRAVTVEDLWPGRGQRSTAAVAADFGFSTQSWTRNGFHALLDNWESSGMMDRRTFFTVHGAALLHAVAGLDLDRLDRMAAALSGGSGGNPLIDQIEQSIPYLQRLDDAFGGGGHLAYVGSQFTAVAAVIRRGGLDARMEQRLFCSLAEIGQLAGWMALDAGRPGLAQRYLLAALRAADEAGYRAMAAHILGDLSFQAAGSDDVSNGVTLAERARSAAANAPATVRASVLSRAAYAYAMAGDHEEFERAYDQGREAIESRGTDEPSWMYYLTANHLDAQAGYALIQAGNRMLDNGQTATATPLLERGCHLLRTGAHDAAADDSAQQRRALFEGAWLAVGSAGLGDVDGACTTGSRAISRTNVVTSARSTDALRTLRTRLRHRRRNEQVAALIPALDSALAAAG